MELFLLLVAGLVIFVQLAQSGIYFLQLLGAGYGLRRYKISADEHLPSDEEFEALSEGEGLPTVSILVPAFNEQATIIDSVRSLLDLNYPHVEIVVVNDGSQDETLERMVNAYRMRRTERVAHSNQIEHQEVLQVYESCEHPNLLFIDKKNGGKADALNAGINLASGELVASVDADSLLDKNSLRHIVATFLQNEGTIAVGGMVRIVNGCTVEEGQVVSVELSSNLLVNFQIIEYLRAFILGRLSWSEIRTLMLISGAFGVFDRQALLEIGGYDSDTVGEDFDLVVRVHRHFRDSGKQYGVKFVPNAVCWTQAPSDVRSLIRQRTRWQRGALETVFRHLPMFGRVRYGRAGSLGVGTTVIADVLGPPAELLGYVLFPSMYFLDILSLEYMLLFLFFGMGYNTVVSVTTLAMDQIRLNRTRSWHTFALVLLMIVENFGYRQFVNGCRLVGWMQYFINPKAHRWGQIKRSEFSPAST